MNETTRLSREIKALEKYSAKLQREFKELHAQFRESVGRFNALNDKRGDLMEDYLSSVDACSHYESLRVKLFPEHSQKKVAS
jgi:septal ring factor EnvC (AmiA/AmiB activator)